MIESIRKYTFLIIFCLAVVIASLVIGNIDDLFRNGAGTDSVYQVANRGYSYDEYQKLGQSSQKLSYEFARQGNPDVYRFILALSSVSNAKVDPQDQFFINRVILREAKNEYGVNPSHTETLAFLQTLSAFATSDGKFDPEKYNQFVKNTLHSLNLNEHDLHQLISDILAYQKIETIVTSGISANPQASTKSTALDEQRISGQIATLPLAPITATIKLSDDEVKAFWETIKDAFKTPVRRKFTYVLAGATLPTLAIDEKLAPEAKAQKTAELEALRKQAQMNFDKSIDAFTLALEEKKGIGFAEIAAQHQLKAVSTELFTSQSPPKELSLAIRGNQEGSTAVDELFKLTPSSDTLSKISQPIAVGENQWLIACLDQQEEPRNMTFEEAKELAKAQLASEKALAILKANANQAAQAIRTALSSGRSFADAAKAAGIEQVAPFKQITSNHQPAAAAAEPSNLFSLAQVADPGSLIDPSFERQNAFLVYVEKREVQTKPDASADIKRETRMNGMSAFYDWMNLRIQSAAIQRAK